MCIKAIMRHEYAFRKIIEEQAFINHIAISLRNENARTRLAAVQMLAAAASDPTKSVSVCLSLPIVCNCTSVCVCLPPCFTTPRTCK